MSRMVRDIDTMRSPYNLLLEISTPDTDVNLMSMQELMRLLEDSYDALNWSFESYDQRDQIICLAKILEDEIAFRMSKARKLIDNGPSVPFSMVPIDVGQRRDPYWDKFYQ